jgi:hypothetical protein
MKTEYEKMYKYEFNSLIFGKPKRKYEKFYLSLAVIIPLLGWLFSSLI